MSEYEYDYVKMSKGGYGEPQGWVCTRWKILPDGGKVYAGRVFGCTKKAAREAFEGAAE